MKKFVCSKLNPPTTLCEVRINNKTLTSKDQTAQFTRRAHKQQNSNSNPFEHDGSSSEILHFASKRQSICRILLPSENFKIEGEKFHS